MTEDNDDGASGVRKLTPEEERRGVRTLFIALLVMLGLMGLLIGHAMMR